MTTTRTEIHLSHLSIQAFLIVSAAALLAVGLSFMVSSDPTGAIFSLLLAAGLCGGITCLSLIPLSLVSRRRREWLGPTCLAGSALRLLLTLGTGLGVHALIIPSSQTFTFALGIVGFYLILLFWETAIAVKLIKELYPDLAAPGDERDAIA